MQNECLNAPEIELSLDAAAQTGNPALLAGACVAHACVLFIPFAAANVIHDVAVRGSAMPWEQEVINRAAEYLRALEQGRHNG